MAWCKNEAIVQLKQQLAQQQDEKKQQEEQILDLEEYVHIQEDYFTNQITEAELKATATQEVHEEEKWQWESTNSNLQSCCTELEAMYEKKRLELLVTEAKLMQAEGSIDKSTVNISPHATGRGTIQCEHGWRKKFMQSWNATKLTLWSYYLTHWTGDGRAGWHKQRNYSYYGLTGIIGELRGKDSLKWKRRSSRR